MRAHLLAALQDLCTRLSVQLEDLAGDVEQIVHHQRLFGHEPSDFTNLEAARTEVEAKKLLWQSRKSCADAWGAWQLKSIAEVRPVRHTRALPHLRPSGCTAAAEVRCCRWIQRHWMAQFATHPSHACAARTRCRATP
jgi:hypothetical protein